MDREQERDEAQKTITKLREQLKELEKEKQTSDLVASEDGMHLEVNQCCQRVFTTFNSTVEQLENQMREMTKLIEASERRQNEVEAERKEAIDKIYDLREIIRELELQVESRTTSESELQQLNSQLETVVAQQSQALQELTEQLEAFKFGPEVNQLKDRIVFLEGETQKLRLDQELVGSEGALKEIQLRLHEFETSLEKKTRVLEGLHSTLSSTTCSTPSEEMSVRDQIRPSTPNSALEECDVPLQQLSRLKEKLIKHSRAEDAAVKRIRDLEMQLHTFKQDFEEALGEKEILQNQVTEQIVLLSSLQMRLDEQRLRAELNQKQANTSLEVRIYDLENEVQNLKENIRSKEKLVKQLNRIVDETKERLEIRERELSNKEDDVVLVNLQKEIDQLKSENFTLKTKMESDAQNAQILPGLVDNIIADKNADIEKLRDKLDDTQKQLESFLCLNLDHEQLRQLSHLKCSERAFSDILSLADFSSADNQARKLESRVDNLETSIPFKRNANETTYVGGKFLFEPEMSSIPKIDDHKVGEAPIDITSKQNSTEIPRTDRKVHFEEIEDLKVRLREKDAAIQDYLNKIGTIETLETNIEKLRENLELTESTLTKATETFEREQNDLRVELAEKKINFEQSELDNKRKDDMYKSLAKEKREIELKLNDLQQDLDHYRNFETVISEKNKEIYRFEDQLSKLIESCVALEHYESELSKKQTEFNELTAKYEKLQTDFTENFTNLTKLQSKNNETVEENRKLTKELDNQTRLVDNLTKELNAAKLEVEKKSTELKNFEEDLQSLRETLVDKNLELEILNEDVARYHSEISNLENRLNNSDFDLLVAKNRKELNERDLEIIKLKTVQDDLNKEIRHLQDYLQEKDRVIEQMQEDTKSLHANLETIQNKIQETGNIVDLRKRLQEEQHLNAVLKEEITAFKRSLGAKERSNSIEDIRGEVAKQLEYSAVLDSNILEALNSPEPVLTKDSLEKNQLKSEIIDLHNKLEQERNTIVKLKLLLDQEKLKCDTIQIEDLKLIEQMRIQLDAALDNVNDLESNFELEQRKKHELQVQIERLKTNSSPLSKTELTEYKSLPTGESQEILRLKSEVNSLNELIAKLKTDIKTLKKTKNEHEATLKYTRDLLELKSNECGKFEVRFDELRRNEMDLRERVMSTGTELEQKIREVENSRQLMGELEEERIEMKKENMILSERLRELEEEKKIVEVLLRQKEVEMTSTIPEKVLYKMKELTNDVKKQMQENKVMTETLTKMAMERSKLLDKIRRLEEQNNNRILCDNPAAKGNHLFGKYLRAESYRKALVFQKCYLIKLLLSYQSVGPISDRLVAFQAKHPTKIKTTGIQRFRCCAISLIALARMKFMVKRWHSGVRHGAYEAVAPHRQHDTSKEPENVEEYSIDTEARFQVGQPVSSQNFYPSIRSVEQRFSVQIPRTTVLENATRIHAEEPESPLTEDGHAWSGLTPPQKEKFRNRINTSPSLSPLEAPSLLTEYVKRFNDIQERLGITIEKLNS